MAMKDVQKKETPKFRLKINTKLQIVFLMLSIVLLTLSAYISFNNITSGISYYGIWVNSDDNILIDNRINDCGYYGIYLMFAMNGVLYGNEMKNCGAMVYGGQSSVSSYKIHTNNTVNGKTKQKCVAIVLNMQILAEVELWGAVDIGIGIFKDVIKDHGLLGPDQGIKKPVGKKQVSFFMPVIPVAQVKQVKGQRHKKNQANIVYNGS